MKIKNIGVNLQSVGYVSLLFLKHLPNLTALVLTSDRRKKAVEEKTTSKTPYA